MNISFVKLFEFRMIHDFFPDGICRSLYLRPTSHCQFQLQKFALRYRQHEDGFSVYCPLYEQGDKAGYPTRPIDEEVRFSFSIFTSDAYFLNYSDLPFVAPGKIIYYFSNLQTDTLSDNKYPSLSKRQYVSKDDAVVLRPKMFTEIIDIDLEQISIVNHKNVVVESCVRKLPAEQDSYEIDLRRYEDGIYTLNVSGSPHTVFYAEGELGQDKIFGRVDLYVNTDVPAEGRFVDLEHPEHITSQTYSVDFARRLTTWRYFVVPRSIDQSEEGKLQVRHEKNVHSFTRTDDVHITGGEKALVFQSDEAIPLSMKPNKDIALQISRNGDDYVPIIPHLSSPKVSSIQIDPDSETVYSDVFIYI